MRQKATQAWHAKQCVQDEYIYRCAYCSYFHKHSLILIAAFRLPRGQFLLADSAVHLAQYDWK